MHKCSPWTENYETLIDGRTRISRPSLAAFERDHRDRVLVADIRKRPSKVVFFDSPFRVGEEFIRFDGFQLFRISIRELPNWPPVLGMAGEEPQVPDVLVCSVKSVRVLPGAGTGTGGAEFQLEHRGRRYKAWQLMCPTLLIRCLEATLRQEGAIDSRLINLQELRLIGAES